MKLCFYCVMNDFRKRNVKLKGIDNESIIFIHSNDLYAAVSYTKHKSFKATVENKQKYDWIISELARKTDIAPFGFNTIVGERIGKGILSTRYPELKNELKKLAGKSEFEVTAFRGNFKSGKLPKIKSGSALSNEFERTTDIQGQKLAARLNMSLEEKALESKHEKMENGLILLRGLYLVEDSKISEFQKNVDWLRSLYPESTIECVGPRPAYSFNRVDILAGNTKLFGKSG